MMQKFRRFTAVLVPSVKTFIAATAVVFVACLGITLWSWNNAKQNLRNDLQTTLDTATVTVRDTVKNTLGTYSEVLKGGAGLFNATPDVTEDMWHRYIGNLDITNRYPGLQAIGYNQVVPASELESFLENTRTGAGERYNIQPSTPRDTYVVLRFVEPTAPSTPSSLGYDPFVDNTRRSAMEQARDTGQAAITGRTTLIRDNEAPQPGFIVYLPVYKKAMPIATVEQRRAAVQGYISAGVRTRELINELFAKALTADSAIIVYDGTEKKAEKLIYTSDTYDKLITQPGIISSTQVLDAGKSKWTIVTFINQNIASSVQRKQPQEILIGGTIFSILISSLLLIMMMTRARSITNEKNREVQDAKDSLISLASHQLRTPATGVKQFVGMVLEGYAGKITAEQRGMLEKAYASNDRQIEIINQILHVSRADSGRLVLQKERLNLGSLIQSVIDEQAKVLKDRKQRLVFDKPKQNIYLQADKQYLFMAIDNLLSNASKYSFPKGSILIEIRRKGDEVVITVADKGVGISADDMHLLFQKFSRIHNELSIAAGGNGIGLYLCKQIIMLHGGRIEVDSLPHEGSAFTITLPRQ